jgi:hypothetical protein
MAQRDKKWRQEMTSETQTFTSVRDIKSIRIKCVKCQTRTRRLADSNRLPPGNEPGKLTPAPTRKLFDSPLCGPRARGLTKPPCAADP